MIHSQQGNDAVKGKTYTQKVWVIFFVIVVVSFLCFVPDLYNGLVWDDEGYITTNDRIRSLSFETVRWAFSTFYVNYWAPLTWLSLALDYAFWGLNPVGYHLTNNLIHAINAGMFFLLSLELLNRYLAVNSVESKDSTFLTKNSMIYCSLLAALFFALHPLRVESVAWAAERKDVLSLFFGIPAVIAYLKHTQSLTIQPGYSDRKLYFVVSPYYWLAVFFYCLSVLSKSMLVTLPLVLLVLDWFPLKRHDTANIKEIFLEKFPLLVIAGFVSMLTIISQKPVIIALEKSNIISRVLNALKSIMAYLWLTVWPINLSPFYIHPGNISKIGLEYSLPILFSIIVTTCCALVVKRQPVFMAVWLIYLITLLPVLGFTAVGQTAMAARFTYLPGLSVSLLLALGLTAVLVRRSRSRPAFISMIVGIVVMLLINCFYTLEQIYVWKDEVTLWTRVIELQPRSVGMAYFNRGCGYVSKGDFRKALPDLNEAIAIATAKNYKLMHSIYIVRARILKQLGDLDGAIADYSSALLSDNSSMRSMYYWERGAVYKEQGRAALANEDFRLAVMPESAVGGRQN